jgi:hypothetical protein
MARDPIEVRQEALGRMVTLAGGKTIDSGAKLLALIPAADALSRWWLFGERPELSRFPVDCGDDAAQNVDDIVSSASIAGSDCPNAIEHGANQGLQAALQGMIGLVQLVAPTLPQEQREAVETNHRLVDAIAALARAGGRS